MAHLLLVAIGGGLGAACRHLVGLAALRLFGTAFPIGTLTVNVVGSLLMGLLIGWLALRADLPPAISGQNLRLFVATGILGGFTTFSAFSLETILLWQRGAVTLAVVYVAVSVVCSIGALAIGFFLIRSLT